jgi:hypothetical protein
LIVTRRNFVKNFQISRVERAIHHNREYHGQGHEQHDRDNSLAENQPQESADDRGNGDADHDPAECVREEGFSTAAYGKETVKNCLNKAIFYQMASGAACEDAKVKGA